ncbi:UvrD-helicase domain-containing protein [Vibrio sp. 10N.261.52.C2]|uniref:UvrD-helicase domain-containing protein n=1 Tax=unclassified Vibrio TaxID=2614977 RepID=UPI003552DF20
MESNFLRLLDEAPAKLFESIATAEQLFVDEHYHFVPTAIRSFCEGVLATALEIDPGSNSKSLAKLIEEFSNKFNKPHISYAAKRIQKMGNKASHYEPRQYSRSDLQVLFQDAKKLYEFLIIDVYHKNIVSEPFSLEKLGHAELKEHAANQDKIKELSEQVDLNGRLMLELKNYQQVNRELRQKMSLYEADYSVRQKELEALAKRDSELKYALETALVDDQASVQDEVDSIRLQKDKLEKDVQFYERKLTELKVEEATLWQDNQKLEKDLLHEIDQSQKLEQIRSIPPLSEHQEKLIHIDSGRHFLEAPPGAGKTTILIHRLEKALLKHNDDQDIVCLTFTTRAAEEMHIRAKSVLNDRQPFIGNFHNFCLDSIRKSKRLSFQEKRFGILDDEYREVLLETAKKSASSTVSKVMNPHFKNLVVQTGDIAKVASSHSFNRTFFGSYLLMLTLTLLDDAELISTFSDLLEKNMAQLLSEATLNFDKEEPSQEELAQYIWSVFIAFRELKKQSGTYDFDDILCIGLQEIIARKDKKKYIQIDEVQDLSPIQWEIINAMSDEDSHIFCVGDTYQSIYSFLGADTEKLKKRTTHYERHELINNFRSDKNIVDLLSAYRKFNWQLPELKGNSDADDKQSTLLLGYPDNVAEIHNVILMIEKILEKNSSRQVGLLCSTNKIAESYCNFLNLKKIDFFRVSESDLMQRNEIQDWMSCLRAYQGVATNKDWWRLSYRFSKKWDGKLTKSRCIQFINALKQHGVTVYDILQSGNLSKTSNSNTYTYNLKELVAKFKGQGVVIYDTETTGLNFESDKIVQIAAVKVVNGIITDEFDRYVHLDIESDLDLKTQFEQSQKVHKIEATQVANGQQLDQVLIDFFEFVGDCAVVAHNLTFDETMLKMNSNALNDYRTIDAYHRFKQNVQMDTLLLTKQHFPNQANYKLESLLKDFDLEGVNSHNALDDVKATASLLKHLMGVITPKLSHIDSLIDGEAQLVEDLRENWVEIEKLMGPQTIGNSTSLAETLDAWLMFIQDKSDWYNNVQDVSSEARDKLIPWLEKSGEYQGLLNNLVDDSNPSIAKLFTLKEVDLIDDKKHRLIVSTIHRAKGLEFETVIVPNAVGDTFPPWVPDSASNQERLSRSNESQRLLYVALSRPKNKLIVTYHEHLAPKGFPKGLSPFIEGIKSTFGFSRT